MMPPPDDTRCTVFLWTGPGQDDFTRCVNEGTNWVTVGGCGCSAPENDVCAESFESWECDGPCRFGTPDEADDDEADDDEEEEEDD